MDVWQRRYLKAAVLEIGKKGDEEGHKEKVRSLLMGLFKKLPWGNGSQRTATFDPSDFYQKQHLDLVFRLAKQAFQIRFLNEKLVENNQSQPQAVRTTNICQQLEGGSLNIPSANQLENLVSNIFINS
jgi:hypothetical protein